LPTFGTHLITVLMERPHCRRDIFENHLPY
jgi:hypothetical protein